MTGFLLTVEDLKQYVYCERIPYYRYILPVPRKITFKMEHGQHAESEVMKLERRRSLRKFGLEDAVRHIHPRLVSKKLKLSGNPDMILETASEIFPVDYKFTLCADRDNIIVQLCAYCLLAEETYRKPAKTFFVYQIPSDTVISFDFTAERRNKILLVLESLNAIINKEFMPPSLPAKLKNRCVDCEYQNYCNDIF